MIEIFKQPYPLASLQEAIKRDLFFGLFLTVFLVVFTPFGLDDFAYERVQIIVGYGVVCNFTILINDVIAYQILPHVFNENRWRVYHQIGWTIIHLLVLGTTNLLYGYGVGAFPFTWLSFFKLELYVAACSILPIAVITLARQNYLLKRNVMTAQLISTDITEQKARTISKPELASIKFKAENNKDFFQADPNRIFWIQSQDNYVEFAVYEEGKLNKYLLRSTLSKVEEILVNHPIFFRCHRAFIVNLDKIKSVEGNSQGYRLLMEEKAGEIPVARLKNKSLRELIQSRVLG